MSDEEKHMISPVVANVMSDIIVEQGFMIQSRDAKVAELTEQMESLKCRDMGKNLLTQNAVLREALKRIADYDQQSDWMEVRDYAADAMLEIAREALDQIKVKPFLKVKP